MRRFLALCIVAAALIPASLAAKGPTTRIIITALDGHAITVADPILLRRFNVWDGPGTYSGPPGATTMATTGFIADWLAGSAARPERPERYEVKFFVRIHGTGPEQLAYVVTYERDPQSGDGFVYLPGRSDPDFTLNVRSIHRGAAYEGHWFRATREWQEFVTSALK